MGSRYFATCRPDFRFDINRAIPIPKIGWRWLVFDWDTRRIVYVVIPKAVEDDQVFVFESLAKIINDLPLDIVEVEISEEGELLSTSSELIRDSYYVPFYPRRTEFPRHVNTIQRSDLTEIDRLGVQVDLVTYNPRPGETKKAVFKYYLITDNVARFWHEINCVMRMPRHPNIVSFDALVVEKVAGVDRVVGFTTRYIPGGTLEENKSRVFKLKYLEQLIATVDYLNLRLGIVHGDICPWNLLIDPETDSIKVFDFNQSAKLGWDGDVGNEDLNGEFAYDEDCNDVKFVIFTIYEIITREFSFRREFEPDELDESVQMAMSVWEKHPDVLLDSPVEDYRRTLEKWSKERAEVDKKVDHFSKASDPLDWPTMRIDTDPEMVTLRPVVRLLGALRGTLVHKKQDYVRWERPATSVMPLPDGQRLLATGEMVVDNGDGAEVQPRKP
ncbi:Protein kinase-like domain containing protein [Naviculisporaceae sp. PSN 640]